MSTVDFPTLDQVLATLQSWQKKSPSKEDKVEFFEIAISDLQNSHNKAVPMGNFDDLRDDAVRNDAAFLAVTIYFIELILKYLDYELLQLAAEWNTYRTLSQHHYFVLVTNWIAIDARHKPFYFIHFFSFVH